MARISRPCIGCDNDESNHSGLVQRQPQAGEYVDI